MCRSWRRPAARASRRIATTLSTEDNFSGKGESVGKGVKTSTATTVEEANAADEEPSSQFQINQAGGVAAQSSTSKGAEHVYTGPGGAPSRGSTGAGQGSVPAGMGVSD